MERCPPCDAVEGSAFRSSLLRTLETKDRMSDIVRQALEGSSACLRSRLVPGFSTFRRFRAISLPLPALLSLLSLAAVLSLPSRARADVLPDVPVDSVLVRGNHTAETELIIRTLNVPTGEPLSVQRLRNGTKALWNLGLFSAISVESEPNASGQKLILLVTENPRISAIDITGNKKIGTEDLKGKLTLRAGQLFSRGKLDESCRAIEKAYEDEGYASAACTAKVDNPNAEQTLVTFTIVEGARVRVKRIEFEGNTAFRSGTLRKLMKLKPNSLFHRKRYTADLARENRDILEQYYHNHGYRDATATLVGTDFGDGGHEVTLRYQVAEGPFYVFGDRSWTGNTIVTTAALNEAARFLPGDPFSQEKLDQTTAEAYSLYTEKGYLLEVSVTPETSVRHDTVDVHTTIEEGRPSHVHEVKIAGNRRTKEKVIRREMTLFPGNLLRRSLLMRTQRDVFALGFFDDVSLDYQPTGDSTDVDLLFKVKEKSTGSASGGVGYSGDTGITGFLQLAHPNLFGNGQSISLSLERGGRRETYEISFQDPWIFGTPTSFGFDLFNTRRDLDLYSETRRGAGLSFGRPWFYRFPDYTHAFVGYSLENYRYSDFDPSLETTTTTDTGIPLAEQLRRSSGVISSAYVSMVRNSTDSPFYPNLGSKSTLRLEIAGGPLGGDQHYFKPTLDHRVYFRPIWKPAVMLRWRLGYLVPLGGGRETPTTETFRLGGTRPFEYLRGYEDYWVVPESNVRGGGSSQVRFPGGRAMFGFTSELQFPIVNPVHGLLFFDSGNVWNRLGEVSLNDLKESFGAGLRFEIPLLGQVGFDYAYGTAAKDWRFHFIIGPAF
jgi:outer membrane protein insertion porin family